MISYERDKYDIIFFVKISGLNTDVEISGFKIRFMEVEVERVWVSVGVRLGDEGKLKQANIN